MFRSNKIIKENLNINGIFNIDTAPHKIKQNANIAKILVSDLFLKILLNSIALLEKKALEISYRANINAT